MSAGVLPVSLLRSSFAGAILLTFDVGDALVGIMAFVAAIVFRDAFAFMTFANSIAARSRRGCCEAAQTQALKGEPNSKRHAVKINELTAEHPDRP